MADLLTGVRLLLAVPAAVGFARPDSFPPFALAGVVALAIATDYFDGIVARRLGTASPRGRLFDHTTDFLFVTSGLAGGATARQVPVVLPVLIVVAFSQYVLDSYFLHGRKELRMSLVGRWNGLLYFVPLVLLSLSGVVGTGGLLATGARWLCWALVLSTVASIVDRSLAPSG